VAAWLNDGLALGVAIALELCVCELEAPCVAEGVEVSVGVAGWVGLRLGVKLGVGVIVVTVENDWLAVTEDVASCVAERVRVCEPETL
jgi:hypothetical protein